LGKLKPENIFREERLLMKAIHFAKPITVFLITLSLIIVAFSGLGSAAESAKPKVIRLGTAFTAGNSNRASMLAFGVLYEHHLLEEEFAKDGIEIEWNFFKGISPAVNEAFASNTIDFGATSDLGAIVGRSNGLDIRLIAGMTRGSDVYVGVPLTSTATKIEDLKGKKLATSNGTNFQVTLARILAYKGLTIEDFEFFNLGPADGVAALIAGNIDAAVYGGPGQLFPPRNAGQIKILYTTASDTSFPEEDKTQTSVFVSNSFLEQYPDIVVRFLKAYLKASEWISKPENQEAYYIIASHTGQSVEGQREAGLGKDPNYINSPLIDNAVVTYYTNTVRLMKDLGLIENTFDVGGFIVKEPIEKALDEMGLRNNWTWH
jgi:sulfonate transport system substrate-binding protein